MKLAAFTLNESVMTRWFDQLDDRYVFLKVSSIAELKTLFSGNEKLLFLIHRSIADKNVIGRLCAIPSSHKVFIFSDQPQEKEGLFFLEKGAVGYANTYISSVLLNQAVDVVFSGRVWIGQKLMNSFVQSLSERLGGRGQAVVNLQESLLTERENEITGFIARGCSNLEIANELNISERTVKAHLSAIYRKTNTQGRLQLALLLHQNAF